MIRSFKVSQFNLTKIAIFSVVVSVAAGAIFNSELRSLVDTLFATLPAVNLMYLLLLNGVILIEICVSAHDHLSYVNFGLAILFALIIGVFPQYSLFLIPFLRTLLLYLHKSGSKTYQTGLWIGIVDGLWFLYL